MIKINYPQDRASFHEEYIKKLAISNDIKVRFYNLMTKTSLKRLNFNNLNYLLLAPFEELIKISFAYKLNKKENKDIKEILNYDYVGKNKHQSKIKSFFENKLKIKSCYFCNIDFVNAFSDCGDYHDFIDFIQRASKEELMMLNNVGDKKSDEIITQRANIQNSKVIQSLIQNHKQIAFKNKYSHFTLDHVMDKSTHPLLALSLYNFVPSCYGCNSKFKGSKPIVKNSSMGYLSPTSNRFSFHDDVKFKIYFYNKKNIGTINSKKDFILDFSYFQNKSQYENYINIFKLKGRYIFHKDEVLTLIKKKEMYSQSQLEEISSIVTTSSQKIKEDIFGKELFSKNLEEVRMTKFKQDIAKDIGILD